jgi:hypothetical protein
MVRPVESKYPVTLGYRQKARFDPNYIHRGIDYGAPSGTPVVATRGGMVVYAGQGDGNGPACGLHVIIKAAGIYCAYYHLSAEMVTVGRTVETGQVIGKVGSTGNSTGPHLHYQEQTGGPGQYKTDRKPQFIDYNPGPIDRMDPKNYGTGAYGEHILWYGQRLEAHGFGDNYTPTKAWGAADVRQTKKFQQAQGWTGADADGLPGRETLKRLAAAPVQAKYPAQVIDLRPWKLTTPFGKEDHPTEIKQPGLNRYADSRCFFVRGDAVVFRVTGSGVTTSGSSYPRTELREMDGSDKASWSTRDPFNLEAEYMVKGNAKVVIAQIHDADDDLVMVSVEGSKVVAEFSKGKGKGSEKVTIGTVGLGTWFTASIGADDGAVWVKLNGQIKVKRTRSRSGCYAKAGAYLQSDKSTAWAEVSIKKDSLKVSH